MPAWLAGAILLAYFVRAFLRASRLVSRANGTAAARRGRHPDADHAMTWTASDL